MMLRSPEGHGTQDRMEEQNSTRVCLSGYIGLARRRECEKMPHKQNSKTYSYLERSSGDSELRDGAGC